MKTIAILAAFLVAGLMSISKSEAQINWQCAAVAGNAALEYSPNAPRVFGRIGQRIGVAGATYFRCANPISFLVGARPLQSFRQSRYQSLSGGGQSARQFLAAGFPNRGGWRGQSTFRSGGQRFHFRR